MGSMKALLRGKFLAIQAYLKVLEKAQINSGNLYWKDLEKKEQTKLNSLEESK